MIATPKSEMKPTAAEMLKLVPVKYKAQTPPIARANTLLMHDHGVQPGSQGHVQEDENQAQREGHNPHQPRLGDLHFLELAGPHGVIRGLEQVLGSFPAPRRRRRPGRGRGR